MKKRLPLIGEQIVSNWLYKLVAFLVALSIWVNSNYRRDATFWRNIDIEFILKPDHVITNLAERVVRVKVSGPRSSLKKMSQSSQVITKNLTGESTGFKHIDIKPSDINLPTGIKLISINPTGFDVEIKEIKK